MRFRLMAFCLLCVCSAAMADEKLDDVKKKIAERTEKHNSVQFKMNTTADMAAAGMTMKSEAKAKYLRKDKKLLWRMETTSEVTMTNAGGQKMEQKGTIISDGEFMWSLNEMMGQKMATKMKVPENQPNPMDPQEGWEKFDITLTEDAKIGDYNCWVMEMVPKDAQTKTQMSKSVVSFDQKTGLMVKQVGYDAQGKVMSTTNVSDIKINEKLDPALFVFKAPEGVQVQDMTNMKGGLPGMGG